MNPVLAEPYLCSFCLRLRSCPIPKTAGYGEDLKSASVISMSCCGCLWLPRPCEPTGPRTATAMVLEASSAEVPFESLPGPLARA